MIKMMGRAVRSLVFLSGILHSFASSTTIGGIRLVTTGGCGCFGETLTYECTIMGSPGGATVWTGTALNCPSDEMVILHQRFTGLGETTRSCNNGATVAQSLYIQDSLYTSQLNITVTTSDIAGKTIKCVYDAMGDCVTTYHVAQFSTVLPGLISPPNKLYISTADYTTKQFTFSWSPVAPDCSTIHYNILASNCGSCPTTTNHTTITCTDVPINGTTCKFAVQPVICGNISGYFSDLINVTTLNIEDFIGSSGILVNTTTIWEEQFQIDTNMTLEQTMCTSITQSASGNSDKITFISSILFATLLITWVPISVALIIIILLKLNIKTRLEREVANQGLTNATNFKESCNVESKTVIDTSDNVAYGMFTRCRHYL